MSSFGSNMLDRKSRKPSYFPRESLETFYTQRSNQRPTFTIPPYSILVANDPPNARRQRV